MARKVDLPAFGSPTMPASAISLSRSQIVSSSPGRPGLAWRGAWLVDDLKCALPKPPLPPLASRARSPGLSSSASSVSWSSANTCVPGGTAMTTSSPPAPERFLPMPARAVLGLEVLLIAVVDQRVEVGDALDPDVAALAAVAAVGAAELDELLAPERDAAAPPSPERM